MTSKELYEWRQQGATYQEIADAEGISKQAVYLKVKSYEKKLEGNRGRRFDINKIVYKGFYEYFVENPDVRISTLTDEIFGVGGNNVAKTRQFLYGEHETLLKIRTIKTMMEITGKSFEELFERRRVK